MPSQPSSLTPLGFTREYQTYRAANFDIPFIDSRLLAAVRFWSRFIGALESDSYSSFWLEDLPPLLAITSSALDDLHPEELAEIAEFVTRLDASRVPTTLTAAGVWHLSARKWLYVGEAERALQCLAAGGLRGPELGPDIPNQSIDPPHLPNVLVSQLGNVHEALKDWLTGFDAEWRAIRELGFTNQATCALVERDAAGRPVRGRLRVLEGHVEPLPKERDADEVVFGHQLVTPDDPQVRGAYTALAVLRSVEFGMRNAESKTHANVQARSEESAQPRSFIPHSEFRIAHSFLRARFTFSNGGSREPYGGDSLAFACFTAAYGDWWSKELHRERRLIAAQVAFTGALKSDGQAEQVAESSLAKKVERVFFSPLAYLIVPQANRAAAEGAVAALHGKYPNRRLRILTAERAADLISDGNIAFPERVCFVEYAVRAAKKYSRSMKAQVPILVLLLFIAGWIGLPSLRAALDRNPVTISWTEYGFEALNQYRHSIWQKKYPIPVVNQPPYVVYDLDGDKTNEVLYYVGHDREAPDDAKIDVFNSDGSLRFRLDPVIPAQYPGDYEPKEPYTAGMVAVVVVNARPVIVTGANAQNPSRFHIKMWSAKGDSLGWYVNAGVASPPLLAMDVDCDGVEEIVFPGYNVRMRSCAIFALTVEGSYGVSPPYVDDQYELSQVILGNQIHYMCFPVTDLTLVTGMRLYNSLGGVHEVSSNGFRLDVLEGMDTGDLAKGIKWAVDYYIDSTLHVVRVDVDDSYKARREALVRADSLQPVRYSEYFQQLQDTVTYWTDSGWATDKALRDRRLIRK